MGRRAAGRGLMTAGAIVTVVGVGVVLVRTMQIPGYWMPMIVGVALFLAGVVAWATSKSE
jgi:hypothetical protein